jgi:DNA-binding response OmpR family regulator
MVTALDSDDCRRRGYEAGADAYFAKPFDPDEVIATIQTLLAKATHA